MKPYKVIKKIATTHFGKIFTIDSLLVEAPNGNQAEFYIRHSRDFSLIIPIIDDQFIMVKQFRFGANKISLEFPMGWTDHDNIQQAASRELAEETGYTAKEIKRIGYFFPSSGYSTGRCIVFLAQDLQVGQQHLDKMEEIEIVKISMQEFAELVAKGEITDGPTLAAYGIYKAWSR